MLAAQAKERQRGSQGGILLPQNSAEVQKGETREDIAKIAGVSNNLSVWSKFLLPFRLLAGGHCMLFRCPELFLFFEK